MDYIDELRNTMKKVKASHPFRIDAMVVLPDHLHAVWTLPEGDADYPMRWSLIKAGFSRCVPKDERRNPSRIAKGERGIWQRRYWEHLIRDERDYEKHVEYIHYNPVNDCEYCNERSRMKCNNVETHSRIPLAVYTDNESTGGTNEIYTHYG